MISNKTAAILLLVALNTQLVTSTSPEDTQESSPSGRPPLQVRKRGRAPITGGTVMKLKGMTSTVRAVQLPLASTEEIVHVQEQQAPRVNKEFEELFNQGKYEELVGLGDKMNLDEFMKEMCPLVKTPEQFSGIDKYLRHFMVDPFYAYVDTDVFKKAIVESSTYGNISFCYIEEGVLETALFASLKKDNYDRVFELFSIRKELTVENDGQLEREGQATSFKHFMWAFLKDLANRVKEMLLKGLLTLRGDELKNKHPDIFDIICRWLVGHLSSRLDLQIGEESLTDLIGQSSILTPVTFTEGFLHSANDQRCSFFIKYGWNGAIREGLKKTCLYGGEELWRVMKEKHSDRFSGDYPDNPDALAAVLAKFPTKQELEEQWIEKNAPGFLGTLKQALAGIFPIVLISIVIEYGRPTWIDARSIKP